MPGPLMIAEDAALELALVTVLLLGLAPFFQQPVSFSSATTSGSFSLSVESALCFSATCFSRKAME